MKVILSSFTHVEDLFTNVEVGPKHARTLFFGLDGGDQDSWREALNFENQAKEYGDILGRDKGGVAKMKERFQRLEIEPQNKRRNQIRYCPYVRF